MVQESAGPAAEHPDNITPGVPDSTTPDSLESGEETMIAGGQNHAPPIVQELAGIITSAPDLSGVSQPFFNAVQKLADCQVASIYAINEDTNVVTTLLFASTLPIQRKAGESWPFSGNAVELHAKLGHPHIQDVDSDHPFPGTRKYLEAGIKRSLWAPLIHQGRTIGLLILRSTRPDAFSHDHLASISHLATLIAPSVDQAIKLWETRQDHQTTQALNQSLESLNIALDYRQTLELICQKCCELLASHYAVLAEIEGDELVYRWAWLSWLPGPFQPDEKESRRSLKQPSPGLAARVALTGQAEIINYPTETLREELDLELLGFTDVNSVMAVSLVESGRVTGVLITGIRGTNQRFVHRYLLVAEAFAAHAAATLQNARLYQTAQRYSAEIALIADR